MSDLFEAAALPAPRPASVCAVESPHYARCVELGHPGDTYNPLCDATWCRCGAAVYAGDWSADAGHIFCCAPTPEGATS